MYGTTDMKNVIRKVILQFTKDICLTAATKRR